MFIDENSSLTDIDRYIRQSIAAARDPDIVDLAIALRKCVAAVDYYESHCKCDLFDWSKEYVVVKRT